jgi:transposase
MPKNKKSKKILTMLARGQTSQKDIASILHCNKRDVSLAAKAIREHGLGTEEIEGMDDAAIAGLFLPAEPRAKNESYLQPDMEAFVERKKKNRKIPVKQFWGEYCASAAQAHLASYSYQTFCEMFADVAQKADAVRHFVHEPGAKAFIDWAGDTGWLTDKISGKKTKVYIFVICLPFSGRFYAQGFGDMTQGSWLDGHMNAFDGFGGVPHMLVPDNCATATDRTPIYITLVNDTYGRFAEHYGTAIVPARVRAPRDKSHAESSVHLIEQWIIGPSNELTFYTLDEFNEFVSERCAWLNERPFSDREGSRMLDFENEERDHLLPLPASRYEICEWRCAKVAPDYHIRIDYMHYSVPHTLIGKTCDVRLSASKVEVIHDGEIIAIHPRLYGRKNQYSTNPGHMPENHRNLPSPWSPERFTLWAERIGPATKEAIGRALASRVIVEQSFVSCRNMLGLAKKYGPALLERACERIIATPAHPSYTALKNIILSISAEEKYADGNTAARSTPSENLIDRAQGAGRVQGADVYRRDGVTR